jgi:Glycine rich protein
MIDLRRYALGAVVMVAVLTGCSGTQPPMASPSAVDPPRKTKQSQTFVLTYAEQTFVVPTGVTRVTITASGASGGASAYESGVSGLGGWVRATIPVTPGESLAVFVGGQGYRSYSSSSGLGGFNGGGASNCYDTVSDCSVGAAEAARPTFARAGMACRTASSSRAAVAAKDAVRTAKVVQVAD